MVWTWSRRMCAPLPARGISAFPRRDSVVQQTPPRRRGVLNTANVGRVPYWQKLGGWGGRWDSNPRRPDPQSGALPTELRPPDLDFSRSHLAWDGAPGRTRTCNPRLSLPPLLSQPPPLERSSWSGLSLHRLRCRTYSLYGSPPPGVTF